MNLMANLAAELLHRLSKAWLSSLALGLFVCAGFKNSLLFVFAIRSISALFAFFPDFDHPKSKSRLYGFL
jgi:hypothetical protein